MTHDTYGVIVSARVAGRIRNAVGYGRPSLALEDAIAMLERHGEIEEILSISSPTTIARDLKHTRRARTNAPNPGLQLAEPMMLAAIGRSDLAPVPVHVTARRRYWQRILGKGKP